MRFVFNQRIPPGTRILLIESGSRSILEGIIAHLHAGWGEEHAHRPRDLLRRAALRARQRFQDISRCRLLHPDLRRALLRELRQTDYAFAGIICAAEPVMTKWKWWLAAQVPAKFFVINENGDYFWLNSQKRQSHARLRSGPSRTLRLVRAAHLRQTAGVPVRRLVSLVVRGRGASAPLVPGVNISDMKIIQIAKNGGPEKAQELWNCRCRFPKKAKPSCALPRWA